jgi:hypothetical protein
MIKKILFALTVIGTGSVVAQNLTLRDDQNNSIEGKTLYLYGNGSAMSETKLHVANGSASNIVFDARVYELTNLSGSDLQVCFGSQCYVAFAGNSAAQYSSDPVAIAPAMGSYNDYKVAPFSMTWIAGTTAKWMVSVVNSTNSSDSSSACVVWTVGSTFAGDLNANTIWDSGEIAGDLNGNSIIDAGEIAGDMDGSGTIDVCEVSGDINGNGIIDNGEVLSTMEFMKSNVKLEAYPNPVSNNLTIYYSLDRNTENVRIDVYDIVGQIIRTYALSSNEGQLKVNVDDLNSGVYFYAIKIDEETVRTERVIVK